MLYYRVNECADGKPLYHLKSDNNTLKQTGLYLIEGELFTPCERAKIANGDFNFTQVNISKKKIHYSFGARFEVGVYPLINGHKYILKDGKYVLKGGE